MTSPFSEGFSELVSLVGTRIVDKGEVWAVTEYSETDFFVRQGLLGWVLTQTSRGSVEQFMLSTASPVGIEKYLTCVFGDLVRRRQNYEPIKWPGYTPRDMCPRYRLNEAAPGQVAIVDGQSNTQAVVRGDLRTSAGDAAAYSWIIDSSLADVRASHLDRYGLPLFPGMSLTSNRDLRKR